MELQSMADACACLEVYVDAQGIGAEKSLSARTLGSLQPTWPQACTTPQPTTWHTCLQARFWELPILTPFLNAAQRTLMHAATVMPRDGLFKRAALLSFMPLQRSFCM